MAFRNRWLNCHSLTIGAVTGFGVSQLTITKDGDEVTDGVDNESHLSFASVQNQVDRISVTCRNINKVLLSVGINTHKALSVIIDGTQASSNLTVTATATDCLVLAPGDAASVPRGDNAEGTINLIVLNNGLSVA